MRKFSTQCRSLEAINLRIRYLTVAAIALTLVILIPNAAKAQQIPPRIYQLQEYRKIVPTPVSNADRLRR